MFRLLTIMVLVASTGLAQQAAPVAPPASNLSDMVNQAIFAAVSAFLLFVINYAKTLIATHLKKQNHERGVAVIQDAFYSALGDINATLLQVQSDKDLKVKLDEAWMSISLARLDDLYGFSKSDIKGWTKVQMGIFWGKLAAGKV